MNSPSNVTYHNCYSTAQTFAYGYCPCPSQIYFHRYRNSFSADKTSDWMMPQILQNNPPNSGIHTALIRRCDCSCCPQWRDIHLHQGRRLLDPKARLCPSSHCLQRLSHSVLPIETAECDRFPILLRTSPSSQSQRSHWDNWACSRQIRYSQFPRRWPAHWLDRSGISSALDSECLENSRDCCWYRWTDQRTANR